MNNINSNSNTHLEHLEDLIYEGISIYNEVKKDLKKYQLIKDFKCTIKFDGTALFFGIDNSCGKFFVGTKSIFNKSPKINYSIKDIMNNHGHSEGLCNKLITAYGYLEQYKNLYTGIYQSDLMFIEKDLEYIHNVTYDRWGDVEDNSYFTFQPNTIIYKIQASSMYFNKIKDAKIGLAIHGYYENLDSTLEYNFTVPSFGVDVLIFDINTTIQASLNTYNLEDSLDIDLDVYDKLKNNGLFDLLKIYENDKIKNYSSHLSSKYSSYEEIGFLDWLCQRFAKESTKVSTAQAKMRKLQKLNSILEICSSKESKILLDKIFYERSRMVDFKNHFLENQSKCKLMDCFYEVPNKDLKSVNKVHTSHEGFVLHHKTCRYKIVNRVDFSRANFLYSRFNK